MAGTLADARALQPEHMSELFVGHVTASDQNLTEFDPAHHGMLLKQRAGPFGLSDVAQVHSELSNAFAGHDPHPKNGTPTDPSSIPPPIGIGNL